MPWKEQTVKMSREEFAKKAIANERSISALCREYGISRPTDINGYYDIKTAKAWRIKAAHRFEQQTKHYRKQNNCF